MRNYKLVPAWSPDQEMQYREGADLSQDRDLDTRMMSLRLATVNEEERSVEAVLTTEDPVEMYDWRAGEMIDEVLLGEAVQLPRQIPLLATHNRYSLDSVLGSVRSIRAEDGEGGSRNTAGRLFFADGDEFVDRVWNKVRQGHMDSVSIGYRIHESVEIAKGQTATVRGRQMTATYRRLRVATKWTLHELSVVPIGADAKAKMRANHLPQGVNPMDPKLRAYLESIGLRVDATVEAAWQFAAGLQGEQRAAAQQVLLGVEQRAAGEAPAAGETRSQGTGNAGTATGPASASTTETPAASGAGRSATPEEAARAAVAAERERVREITEAAGTDVPVAVRQQAINEGWSLERANSEFLVAVRAARQADPQTVPYQSTAHTGSAAGANARTLAASLIIGQGIDPVATGCRMHRGYGNPLASDAITAEDCERGHGFRRMSAADLVRECVRLDTGRLYWDVEEAMRMAPSGGSLSYVFTTNVYARLIEGWQQMADTTVGWCDEEDVANFLQQEDISLQASSRLEKLGRGDTAKDATVSDTHETYKIARYAKKFTVDEQDVINDRLGAIMRMPMEMGQAARNLRPDLVYSLMLENPALVADSGTVFNATAVTTAGGHANLGTAILSSTGLKAAITAMVKQRLNRTAANPGQQLVIRPKFLIVPAALEWEARSLTSAAALAKLFADSSDPYYAQLNLLAQEGLRAVPDDRIGAIGVTDPRTGAARTGSDTNWFLTSGANRGLRVAYRRGTGRSPQMRQFVLDKGQWGIGWDINMDIGAAFMDFRTWYKSTGAA